jgi:hypothetical protein
MSSSSIIFNLRTLLDHIVTVSVDVNMRFQATTEKNHAALANKVQELDSKLSQVLSELASVQKMQVPSESDTSEIGRSNYHGKYLYSERFNNDYCVCPVCGCSEFGSDSLC